MSASQFPLPKGSSYLDVEAMLEGILSHMNNGEEAFPKLAVVIIEGEDGKLQLYSSTSNVEETLQALQDSMESLEEGE